MNCLYEWVSKKPDKFKFNHQTTLDQPYEIQLHPAPFCFQLTWLALCAEVGVGLVVCKGGSKTVFEKPANWLRVSEHPCHHLPLAYAEILGVCLDWQCYQCCGVNGSIFYLRVHSFTHLVSVNTTAQFKWAIWYFSCHFHRCQLKYQ